VRRRLDPALEEAKDAGTAEAAQSSFSLNNNASFDSLDQVLQDMEVIQQLDSLTTVSPTHPSNSDPKSQYTASQRTQNENDNNSTPSRQDFSPTANLHDDPESQYNACHDMNDDPDASSSPGRQSTL
jgi:hypothetical protein